MTATPIAPVFAETVPAGGSPGSETLLEIYHLLIENHYSRPDADRILQGAIQGMLEVVNDPYTSYMTPAEYAEFLGSINQQYAGIGVGLENSSGRLLVSEVYDSTPAQAAGLRMGDEILEVDGLRVDATNSAVIPEKIRGAEGSQVRLLVRRGDAEPFSLAITRREIQLPMTTTADLGQGIHYLRIFSFGEHTAQEAIGAVTEAEQSGAKGLVIDLRGNGGGSVVAALEIADALLSEGTILVAHDENGELLELNADPAASQMPVVVLIDRNSASASEILAGALQKNGRAQLVGSRSFGKGTMQQPVELSKGGVLKLSVDRWQLADGSSPDVVGLTPDVPVETTALTLHAATSLLAPQSASVSYDRLSGSVQVSGQAVELGPLVLEREGKLYLPLRFTLEAMGHAVGWSPAEAAVSFTMGGQPVTLDLQAGSLRSAGLPLGAPGDLFVTDGRTYLSLPLLDSLTGISATADGSTVTVRLGD